VPAHHQLNQLSCPTLALDCPSGLNAYTGQAASLHQSQHTLTFLCHKPGLFYAAGADHAGQVELRATGLSSRHATGGCRLLNRQDARMLRRERDSHKGSHGTVCIVGAAPA
jgi:hypothetical protein